MCVFIYKVPCSSLIRYKVVYKKVYKVYLCTARFCFFLDSVKSVTSFWDVISLVECWCAVLQIVLPKVYLRHMNR